MRGPSNFTDIVGAGCVIILSEPIFYVVAVVVVAVVVVVVAAVSVGCC